MKTRRSMSMKTENASHFPDNDVDTCLSTRVKGGGHVLTCSCLSQDPVIKFLIQTKAAGWKANDWNLKTPDWRGKMRLVQNKQCVLKREIYILCTHFRCQWVKVQR